MGTSVEVEQVATLIHLRQLWCRGFAAGHCLICRGSRGGREISQPCERCGSLRLSILVEENAVAQTDERDRRGKTAILEQLARDARERRRPSLAMVRAV